MSNFEKTVIYTASEKLVFDALTNSITKWWTEMFEGKSNEQGKSFTFWDKCFQNNGSVRISF